MIIVAVDTNNPWDTAAKSEKKWAMEADAHGMVYWTEDSDRAKRFEDFEAAANYISSNRPRWEIEEVRTV